MSRTEAVREFFLAAKNMGAERTGKELADELAIDNSSGFSVTLHDMTTLSHELLREKNQDGRWVYRWNDKREPRRRAQLGGGDAKPPKRKVQRNTAKRAARKCRIPAVVAPRAPDLPRSPLAAHRLRSLTRWALTEDGAFVDLKVPGLEIAAEQARALISFIRKLDHTRA